MIYYLAFFFQGAALFFDEFYFHHRRGLPLWERVGHPLDTLSVLACYVWLVFREPTDFNLNVYIGLAIFSSIFVTKDEFVHSEHCQPGENWLHSVLFILHPVTFLCAALIWLQQSSASFLVMQSLVVGIFMVYQIVYWSLLWKKRSLK